MALKLRGIFFFAMIIYLVMNGYSLSMINFKKDWMFEMKNSWKIFSNDIKNVGTNWVALVIIGGLIILPSLYAWLNIKASWDPYGQTEQIPVGIVNEDLGETIRDEDVDVGKELVDTLKDNDTMEWHFLNRESAMDQLEKGDLFAVVVIPEDFSQNLGTVIKPDPKKANVEYYVNEKLNAIAPKITQKGASVIVDEVSSNFISTVNGVIFDLFNEIGLELEADLPDIERFENYVFEMESRLPEIHETLDGTLLDANEAKSIVSKAQKAIPEAEDVVNSGLETIDNTTDFLKQAENRLNEMEPKIEEDISKTQETASVIHSFFDELDSTNINFEEGKALKEDIRNKVDDSIERIETVENSLEAILEQMTNDQNPALEGSENNAAREQIIQDALDKLNQIKAVLEEGRNNTDEIDTFIDEKKEEIDDVLGNIKELSGNVEVRLGEFMKEYNESIKPTVLEEVGNAKNTLS